MTMEQEGEKGYIAHLFDRYSQRPSFTATSDDAAIVKLADAHSVALKIDRGPSAVSYKFGLSDRTVDGRLAATACCSDLLAVWSRPRALMISVTVPPETSVADLDAALDGFLEVCEENDVEFIGGDTKSGQWNLVACGLGEVQGGSARRNGGQPGDVIVVCGEVGSFTAATLRAMELTNAISIVDATRILSYPTARWREAEWLRDITIPSSATDASDGLYDAILNVASRGCGVRVEEEEIPFSDVARRVSFESSIPLSNFLYGGGDWNLVLTISRDEADSLAHRAEFGHLQMTIVGEVTAEQGFVVSTKRKRGRKLKGLISDHFLGRIEDSRYFATLRDYNGWED